MGRPIFHQLTAVLDFRTHFRGCKPPWASVRLLMALPGMIALALCGPLAAQQPGVDSLNAQATRLLETNPEKALNLSLQSV